MKRELGKLEQIKNMKLIYKNTPNYIRLSNIKANLLSKKFNRIPDKLFNSDICYIIPTCLSLSQNKINETIMFIKKISSFHSNNKFYIIHVYFDMEIAGDFINSESIGSNNISITSGDNFIFQVDKDDSFEDIKKVFSMQQFDYSLGDGYLVFDDSNDWVLLELDDIDATLYFSFIDKNYLEITHCISPSNKLTKNELLENYKFEYSDRLEEFVNNYLSKCIY